ncbi:RNA exonuclease 1 homolog isoform X2 [Varanus komodoensis]|uniref:RNA exonuclease 1 homolog isoform X2 n=1 Tax=Varanus komodoensis TaxID=61221 RepID=UPI001CF7AAD4|nr:RNA exonuclease 1 homolog isoform X2 [Varanus komodoensis]
MLRSSGFFRGVDCPFGPACGRPYCHFRHPLGAQLAFELSVPRCLPVWPGPARRPAAAAGSGYDPYNPELPKPPVQSSNGTLGDISKSAASILEMELVDKAIEVAKNEYELEQKKYEELLETSKAPLLTATAAELVVPDSFPSQEYTVGSYGAGGSADYNPTPLAAPSSSQPSKYTLDSSSGAKSKGSSLEYVPTMVTQPRKYGSPVTNSKYIIDNSKPSTDLEYDPLSNYSARLLSKVKEEKSAKRKRTADSEVSSLLLKKHCDEASMFELPAKFSDSEEECEPASSTPLKSQGSLESKGSGGSAAKEKGTQQVDASSRQMRETAVQYDMGDIENPQGAAAQDMLEKDAKVSKESSGRQGKGGGAPKGKPKKKKGDGHQLEQKKDQSRTVGKEKIESKGQRKNGERGKGRHGRSHVDGQQKNPEKPRSMIGSGSKEESAGKDKTCAKGSGMEKAGSSKKDGKLKPLDLKKKTWAPRAEPKDRKGKPLASERPKDTLASSLTKGKSKAKCQAKQRAPSHADLFGDESGDEGQASQASPASFPNVSSDSDGDGGSSSQDRRVKNVRQPKPPKAPSSRSSSSGEVDYSLLEKDLDFESDPMEECLRIFNESTDIKMEDKGRLGKQPSKEGLEEKVTEESLTTLFPGQRRRISHIAKQGNAEIQGKAVVRPYRPPTAQEVCYQRIQLAQQQAAQLAQQQQQQPSTPAQSPKTLQKGCFAIHRGGKKRIAHVPSAALPSLSKCAAGDPLQAFLPRNPGSVNSADCLPLKARTLTGMASKTTTTDVPKRIAHAPTLQSTTLKRPVIPTEYGARVPTNIRQRYLNLFIDECLKMNLSHQEAFDKALSEEKVVYERSTSRNIYLNVAVNTLKKLRSQLPNASQEVRKITNPKVVSHEAVLGGKLAAKTSFTLNRSASTRVEDLTGAALYRRLKEYILTEQDLKVHGYPLPCPEKPGRAVLFAGEERKTSDGSCRVCCRCGTEYMVTASGNCVRKEECVHHWGRLRKQRVLGGWETYYSCCSGAVGTPGCQIAKQHVYDGRKENLEGFVKTFEKLPSADGNPGIYALDCEMCYTKQGLELTRITVIDSELKVVYDTFVKPDHKVVDYNTRFSGVTEADLENVSVTLRDVQAVLLCMFSSETILIGHSLESDLFALKLIHCTVVDTAVVFPHRLGLPYKRALRTLMADYLKRIIQDSGQDRTSILKKCVCGGGVIRMAGGAGILP